MPITPVKDLVAQAKTQIRTLPADEVRLAPSGHAATVRTVEYQGNHVAVTSAMGEAEVLALIPDHDFFKDPKNPGDAVSLAWDEGRLHRLQA